ncbi:MucB/RseB C-terminal domain-containing protein [Ottowia sp.]|uniref:MucB/RseB C-terminal domain-containing protein n=1 Tax=Ottowia sp. TaxID=1898956 RepID=UPI003A87C7A3
MAQQMGSFGGGGGALVGPPERTISEWLLRLQQASSVPSYSGTFVVTSATGAMSSARIVHVCEAGVQWERVDALSGQQRSTFRRNNAVVTFFPKSRTMQAERSVAPSQLPNLFAIDAHGSTADFYTARQTGSGRVAGFDADIVYFFPRDALRFGYRVWSEKRTGLVIKAQTLDHALKVLEQSAFSELQFDVPIKASALQRMMSRTEGYRAKQVGRVRTQAEEEGWQLKAPVPGFKEQDCYRQTSATSGAVIQWIFSDGLATVSLFIEPFDAQRHAQSATAAMGATHALGRKLSFAGSQWWVTAVGEVPAVTLTTFVDQLAWREPVKPASAAPVN